MSRGYITFLWPLSAKMERSDMALSPPKTEPFKVLPSRMAKRPNGKVISIPTPITIALPVPCSIYQKKMVIIGRERKLMCMY